MTTLEQLCRRLNEDWLPEKKETRTVPQFGKNACQHRFTLIFTPITHVQTRAVHKLLDNVLVTSFLILSNFFDFEKLFEFEAVSTNSAKLKSILLFQLIFLAYFTRLRVITFLGNSL